MGEPIIYYRNVFREGKAMLLPLILLASLLLPGIQCKPFPTTKHEENENHSSQLCSSLPSASESAYVLQTKMAPTLIEADRNIQAALKGSPGGAVVTLVYSDQGILWTKGYGLKNMSDASSGAPNELTGFRIGSITKLFTALQTLMLRDSGAIKSLDDNITNYFPEFSIQYPWAVRNNRGITFRQLMSHMSGLPRNAPCKGIFQSGCSISDEEMNKNIAGLRLMYPPGTQPAYSNLGFGLLGKVLARITKSSSWTDLFSKMIGGPLNMEDTGNTFGPSDLAKMALGYYHDGSKADLIDIGWDAAAGQSYSSTADLAKLMSVIFSADRVSSRSNLVDGETIREWMQPAYVYPDGRGYSYPWELVPLGNYALRTKDGVMNGYNAEFQMAVESKIGFIFLHSCDGCASHRKVIEIAQDLLLRASNVLSTTPIPPPFPPNHKDYVGVYTALESKEVVNITTGMVQGNPALIIPGGFGAPAVILEKIDSDSFQITTRGISVPCPVLSSGHIGSYVYFQRDSNGNVVSLTLPGKAYGDVYKKA